MLSAHLSSGGRAVDVHQQHHADVLGEQHCKPRIWIESEVCFADHWTTAAP